MCTTGSEDAVTVQAGTFSWDRNERPVLKKCIWDTHVCSNYTLAVAFIFIVKFLTQKFCIKSRYSNRVVNFANHI